MEREREFTRRSPRFANQEKETNKDVLSSTQTQCPTDDASNSAENNKMKTTDMQSHMRMPVCKPAEADAISTKVTNASQANVSPSYTIETPVSTPVLQQMLDMQRKIEELEGMLKSSLDLKNQRNLAENNHASTSQSASASQHATASRQRPFLGEFEFQSFINGNAAASQRQLYNSNACGNFNLDTSDESNTRQNLYGNFQQNNTHSNNGMTNTIGPSNREQINMNANQNFCMPRKLQDLPQFSGEPELWPMFSVSYQQSSREYAYTNFENCQRLQKSLKGVAFDTVKSLLIHPDNVSVVMEQLEFRFGRPEQLVASQLRVIKEVTPMSESAIGKIISFATVVRNLSVFLQSAGAQQHLANPSLIDELVSKLPMSRKIEWAKYAAGIKPYPTVVDFSNWLNETANILCMISDSRFDQPDTKRKMVLHTTTSSGIGTDKCFHCNKDHRIYKCELFLNKSVDDRWSEVKRLKLCFSCLGKGHSSRECKVKRECSYSDCKKMHNRLLHAPQERNLKLQQRPTANQPVLNCVSRKLFSKVLFKIVPIKLYGPKATVATYAIIDDASAVSLMNKSLMFKLGLNGRSSHIELGWLRDGSVKEKTTVVNVMISDNMDGEQYLLKEVHAVNNLSLPVQSLDIGDMKQIDSNFNTLPINKYSNAVPEVLIGLNNAHLGVATEVVELFEKGPYATNTKLGWIVYGPTANGGKSTSATCLHVRAIDEQSLDELAVEYFSTESFGVRAAPVVESDDDIRARKILEMTQYIDGRFYTGLLWRNDDQIVCPWP